MLHMPLFSFFRLLLVLSCFIIICTSFIIASSTTNTNNNNNNQILPSPTTTKQLLSSSSSFSSMMKPPKVSKYISPELSCKLPKVCSFFKNTLLVIKLNPVRLLWIDKLLKFYSFGFEHIVFYAPREKDVANIKSESYDDDVCKKKSRVVEFLRVGKYNTLVHLVDDNYGFCDHETVASAIELYSDQFDGFFFLSDDVLMQYWRFVPSSSSSSSGEFDLTKFWRQKMTNGKKVQRTPNHQLAWDEVIQQFPDLKPFLDAKKFSNRLPFASTSGIWYFPVKRNSIVGDSDKERFIRISAILNKHRTYNEWGTPFLLECISRGSFTPIRGKLVWGSKRHFVTKIPQEQYLWFHPVRASSEFFARILSNMYKVGSLEREVEDEEKILEWKMDHSSIFETPKCFDCATYPMKQRTMKSLLHSCELVQDEREHNVDAAAGKKGDSVFVVNTCVVVGSDAIRKAQVRAVKKLWPVMGADHVAPYLSGLRFRVRKDRDEIECEDELEHEGFWNQKTVETVFRGWYPKFFANRSLFR